MKIPDQSFRLSVLLVTYNHESYIRQTLDSLFDQVIEDRIELIVADDASSDGTIDIIKGYDGKNDKFSFKFLDKDKNLGITKNYQRGFAACSGEYVAVLEGDDYWVSPVKLQRQIDFLDNHWECDLCSVNYFVYEESRAHFYPRTAIGNGYRLISARDLIADNLIGNFSTCMYRNSALAALPNKLFEICSYDWIVNICVAQSSLIGFLEEPMSVYRLHSNGVWTQTPYIKQLKQRLELIPAYDEITGHIFQADFNILASHLHNLITASHFAGAVEVVSQTLGKVFPNILDYMPPVLLTLVRALMPPKLKRLVVRLFHRNTE